MRTESTVMSSESVHTFSGSSVRVYRPYCLINWLPTIVSESQYFQDPKLFLISVPFPQKTRIYNFEQRFLLQPLAGKLLK